MPEASSARIGLVAPRIPDPGSIPVGPERFREGATEIDVARAAIAAPTIRLLEQDPLIRLGSDPEAIHDARVAVRRIRSHLRTFRPVLRRGATRDLRRELRWLGDVLGEVRDAEVLSGRLRGRLAGSAGEAPDIGPLLQELETRRAAGRRALLSAMRSARYVAVLDELAAWAREPRGRDGRADRPARRALDLMRAPWADLADSVRELAPVPADEGLHRVRIRTKRFRYAAEALIPVAGRSASRSASAAERLQEVLGEHQDAVSALRWLTEQARSTTDPRVAFDAGRLAEMEWTARAHARDAWPALWSSLERRDRFWT